MESTPPEAASRPLSFLAAAAWTLIAAILLGVLLAVIDAAHPGAFTDVVTVAACKVLAYSVVLFGILRVHAPDASIRQVLALRRPPLTMVALGAAVGAGLSPAAMWLGAYFAKRFPASAEESEALEHVFMAESPGKKIALVLTLVVVMPIADELLFRGALFTTLKKGRRVESVILATAAYDALLEGANARALVSLLVTALAIAWLRAMSGSVIPSVAARVAFFAVQVLPIVLWRSEDDLPGRVVLGGLALAVGSLAAFAAVGRRSARARESRALDS